MKNVDLNNHINKIQCVKASSKLTCAKKTNIKFTLKQTL